MREPIADLITPSGTHVAEHRIGVPLSILARPDGHESWTPTQALQPTRNYRGTCGGWVARISRVDHTFQSASTNLESGGSAWLMIVCIWPALPARLRPINQNMELHRTPNTDIHLATPAGPRIGGKLERHARADHSAVNRMHVGFVVGFTHHGDCVRAAE